jgi:hypothetical protein
MPTERMPATSILVNEFCLMSLLFLEVIDYFDLFNQCG